MAEKKKTTTPKTSTKGKAGKIPTLADRIFDDTTGGYGTPVFIPKKKKK